MPSPIQRRLLTIPGYTLAWLVWVVAAPVWILLAAMIDLARGGHGVALRSAAMVGAYLTCELLGIAASAALWVCARAPGMNSDRWTDLHYRLQAWWGATLFRALALLFELRVEVEGDDDLGPGPLVMLLRHASSGDTLLASALVTRPRGIRLRYVLKRELLWDPCLDLVGNRLPNVFVDRTAGDSGLEVGRIRALADDLGPREGVLIYPEGTRYSAQKKARVMKAIETRGESEMLRYARSLERVLPPRLGGTTGLLEATPDADVVICAHTGFEGAASLKRIWRGALLRRVIRVQFRRIPAAQVPRGPASLVPWLLDEWQRVDAWVCQHEDSRWS